MERQNEHLSAEDFDRLLDSTGSVSPIEAGRQAHLDECELCRRRFAAHQEQDARISQLAASARHAPNLDSNSREGSCPLPEQWGLLTTGLVDPARREELLAHASACDSCGAALRFAAEELSPDPTEEELRQIRSLKTASRDWQSSFARGMATRTAKPAMPQFSAAHWLAWAAALVVLAGSVWLAFVRLFPPPAQLLARAYTEQRPFDLRIPGAAYGPVRIEKSGTASPFGKPASLLDAQAKIAKQLQTDPENAEFLMLKARAEMLTWDPEAAISTLTHALDQKPGDPALLADLGTAYALRAESKQQALDYGRAIEYLSRSLKKAPGAAETLFNRAIVYQRMLLQDEALQDWRRYLEIDPKGAWADEARRKLTEIEQKKKVRREALEKITSDPQAFLSRTAKSEVVAPESYLQIAVTHWLPLSEGSHLHRSALGKLAQKLEEQHQDRWLRDVLSAQPSERLMDGLRLLAGALEANLSDDSRQASHLAQRASEQLRKAGSEAAAIRADVEYTYALHRTFAAQACIESALKAERLSESNGYAWILAQARIELGICRLMPGDAGGGARALSLGLETARTAGYRSLELRATGIGMGGKINTGNLLGAWDEGRNALDLFWRGDFVGTRAQQVYENLRRVAAALEMDHAAFAMARASVNSIAETGHGRIEALARIRLARHAANAGYPQIAAEEFARAEQMLDRVGPDKRTLEESLAARLGRAEAQVAAGKLPEARGLLETLQNHASATQVATVLLPFHQLTGEVARHSNEWPEAERAYRAAIGQAERRLLSLHEFTARTGAVQAADKSYRGLVESAWRRGDLRAALRLWEWYRSGERRTGPEETEPDLASLHNETFLVFADLPGGVSVWVFDDRGLEGHRLPVSSEQISEVVRRFTRRCADPHSSEIEIRRDARSLYDWLIAPLEHRLDPARTLVVEPDRLTASVPIQALMDSHNRYVGARFATLTANGLHDYLARVRNPQITKRSRALVIASPALSPETMKVFPPLVQASREGTVVAARFAQAELLDGSSATLATLEQLRPQAELFHFAGHGFSHSGNGGLLLAPPADGVAGSDVLDGNRLAGQDWSRCRLAVLSACSSGTGESGPVNPESLVRRLLWSGAARVVASRWNADAESSLRMMDIFYSAALSGADIAQSLRIAANRIRESDATRHPYFWAGFQVFGSR